MVFHPIHDVEPLWSVEGYRVIAEHVWHDDEVALCSELVGDELGVDELVADYVCDYENGFFGGFIWWIGDVG